MFKILKYIITIYLLAFIFGCSDEEAIYPGIIIRHNLEEQYDLAKWELYQLNSIIENEYETGFVVHLENDTIFKNYISIKKDYEGRGENILLKREVLNDIFGEKNIVEYLECELTWIAEIDSSKIFKGDEIRLTFFPKKNQREYYYSLSRGGLCYTAIFENRVLKGYGCGDYLEWDYVKENRILREEKFIQKIKKQKDKIHPWVLGYYQKNKK